MHRSLNALLTLSLAFLLGACGGGGESSGGVANSGGTATNGETGASVTAPFSSEVAMAPAEEAELSGMVRLEVRGSKMANVELLPANGYLPRHGVFKVKEDGSLAWLDLDTTTLPNGPITVRISAFDVTAGQSGAKEIIAMQPRTWNINNAAAPSSEPFAASLTAAPTDGATVRGTTRLEIRGNGIANAELLPASGYTPRLGVFNVSKDKTHAWLDFDTRSLPDGMRNVRISAFNVTEGQSGAKEMVAMPAREWNFSNGATDAFTATVTMAPPHGAMLEGTTRLEVRGNGLENVELLPANGYVPLFGSFTISTDKTYAYLDIDTEELPQGTFNARISAFNVPPGQSGAKEIIAMPARQWTTPLADGTAPTFSAQLVQAPETTGETFWLGSQPGGGSISPTERFEVSGTGLGNVELVSAKDESIIYGRFTISPDKTRATLDWDYRFYNGWAYGVYEVRVLAWDVPPGESGRMIEVMEPRTYYQKLPLGCQAEGTCGGTAP